MSAIEDPSLVAALSGSAGLGKLNENESSGLLRPRGCDRRTASASGTGSREEIEDDVVASWRGREFNRMRRVTQPRSA